MPKIWESATNGVNTRFVVSQKFRFWEKFGEIFVFGKFLGKIWELFGRCEKVKKKNFKGKCEKRKVSKCKEVCRTYNSIQYVYVDVLEKRKDVVEIRCNVPLEGQEEEYTTDFVCVLESGELMVRETVYRKLLTKPLTMKLLDMSRKYWTRRGVKDWGIVLDEVAKE